MFLCINYTFEYKLHFSSKDIYNSSRCFKRKKTTTAQSFSDRMCI